MSQLPVAAVAEGSRRCARVTAAVYVLAGIAIIDTLSESVRFATDANDHYGWLRLVVGGVASLGFTTWAVIRSRAARARRPARPDPAPPAVAIPLVRLASGRWHWLRWVALLAVMGVGTVTIIDQWGTLGQAVDDLHHLNWHWVYWAIYAEVGSILAFAYLWQRLLRAGGAGLRFGSIIRLTLAGNALLVSLPGGVAWSTAFSFNALRGHGVAKGLATRVLIISSVLSILALVGLALVGVDLSGSSGPTAGLAPIVTGAAVGVGVLAAAVLLWMRRTGALAAIRARLAGLADGLPRRALAAGLGAAVTNWVLDCACLVGAILAVSGHVPWQGVLVAYAVGQLAENLPITPGGIGVVEGTLTLMLVAYGMHNSTALAAVLLYRLISFWLLVPVGWMAAVGLVVGRRSAVAGTRAAPAPA